MTITNTEGLSDEARRIIETYGRETPVDDLALVLFETWCKADPTSGPNNHPASYIATFADMARAALAWNRRAANSTGGVDGWADGIESAPAACTLLATYFDEDVGEWIVQIFVADKPSAPFTHWQFINSPRGPWLASSIPATGGEKV